MRHWLRRFLQLWAIAMAALIFINVVAIYFPAGERVITLVMVIAGTIVLATMRWGIWPFHQRIDAATREKLDEVPRSAKPDHRRRLQLGIVLALIVALLVAWALAAMVWIHYEDVASRSLILQKLAQATVVVVGAAVLVMPPFRAGFRRSGYQLTLAILLTIGWFAGTILLPSICNGLGGSCEDIETFVLAIPGWSFVPVAAMALRSVGARLGVVSWRSFD
ncbi:hypothetical protein [Steroidobacter sp.]|uniref:hypothetical protein n=1 Tax=Steroidobacter sp. TaxID=1978227 RepID=UPI001A5CF7C2|nr:hypothetical protein [Steroidobacter sp.]MBL8269950.1 hypothetical protein [Steroidobacter sp.]